MINSLLQKISQYYFSVVPIKSLTELISSSIDVSELNVDVQNLILTSTVKHPLCLKFSPSKLYTRKFLKWLMLKIEESKYEISEDLYISYAEFIQDKENETHYQSYIVNSQLTVSLEARNNIVSHSTTGLKVWETAKLLTDWSIENSSCLIGKKIVELGAGLGLTGLVLCQLIQVAGYIFTDNSFEVLHLLKKNIDLNLQKSMVNTLTTYQNETIRRESNNHIYATFLDWSTVTKNEIDKFQADVLLAADVLYDPDLFDSLIHLLSLFLNSCIKNNTVAYIAYPERNFETVRLFFQKLDKANLKYTKETMPMNFHFVYTENIPINVYKIFS